jgi:predicted nucleic acid-binding protein
MYIIVDSSVIIAVIANEPERARLIDLTKGFDLIAPLSVHWEIGNAFSSMLKQNKISLKMALLAVAAYSKIPIQFVDVEIEQSLKLASALSIYAYDAYLIRCAIKYKIPLISLDKRLIYSAKKMNVKIIEVPL